jgi:ATP-binding cassette subfamily B protein
MARFIFYRQLNKMDCGPCCLKMIARYHGKFYELEKLRNLCSISKTGVSLKAINVAAQSIGYQTRAVRLSFDQLTGSVPLPCILHWNQNHYVVLLPQQIDINDPNTKIKIADPSLGIFQIDREAFLRSWNVTGTTQGVTLLLEPTPAFYEYSEDKKTRYLPFIAQYLKPFRPFLLQLMLGMTIESILSLAAPFLMQSMVDNGILKQDINFIYLILASQIMLLAGSLAIGIIRSWLMLHMSTRINIAIVSDFLVKLMKLPIRFFDSKMIGDIIQRVSDHRRIEQFLSVTTLHTFFSTAHLVIFTVILGIYSKLILLIFLVGSILSVCWILYFLRKRREIDYEKFQILSEGQSNIYEIINGMQDIKITNSESFHKSGWVENQRKIFKVNLKALSVSQYQNTGSTVLTQMKNILISFVVAQYVLHGSMSLGMMLSVSYIIGLLNAPIDQLLGFFQAAQDASLSLKRLHEIQMQENEEKKGMKEVSSQTFMDEPDPGIALKLRNVSFQYSENDPKLVLNNISLDIPYGKVTAIVGASGSGKTTLLKLLLRYYEPVSGSIYLNDIPFSAISPKSWRNLCGVVMSDGFIFSKTVSANISFDENANEKSLVKAAKTARIDTFIDQLPLKFNTMIGNAGNGISSGQRQRILIARAIYKQPDFLFLDEATNALDAGNEKAIIENLKEFYRGRTVVVIAHRLSTVKYADQIIVLSNGEITEIGNHRTLTETKGDYFQLVKNQLELEVE